MDSNRIWIHGLLINLLNMGAKYCAKLSTLYCRRAFSRGTKYYIDTKNIISGLLSAGRYIPTGPLISKGEVFVSQVNYKSLLHMAQILSCPVWYIKRTSKIKPSTIEIFKIVALGIKPYVEANLETYN